MCFSYEPELHPGVTYKIQDIGATLKIFSTGSITITAPSVKSIQTAVEEVYNLVLPYKNERRLEETEKFPLSERQKRKRDWIDAQKAEEDEGDEYEYVYE